MEHLTGSRRSHSASLWALVGSIWNNDELVLQLAKREVLTRYRGSVFGLAWSFFYPVLMLLVYTFVFSVAFKARWGTGENETKTDFAIILFIGLIIHGLLAECLNRAPGLILNNASYVKKIVFPLEILPWVVAGGALFHAAVSLLVLLMAQLFLKHALPWTVVFMPIVIMPLLLGTVGLTWLLSSIGVYVRDVGQTVGALTTILLFLSPVFYPVESLPAFFRFLIQLNPLTFIVEEARSVLIWERLPNWCGLFAYTAVSLLVWWIGFWWFQRTRTGFADVI